MKKIRNLVLIVVTSLMGTGAFASPITFGVSSGSLAATVSFDIVGGNLQVTLTNSSLSDVDDPPDILTALFFDLLNVGALTPVSATLASGSTVFFGTTDPGGVVGGEWEYLAGLAAPHSATEGISSSGFGLFGSPNFPGNNLEDPLALDGLQYGITSAGDNPATGNAPVTGDNALIHNSVVFVLSGANLPSQLTAADFAHISFQYGTALTEPNLYCANPDDCRIPPSEIPEPQSLALIALALLALATTTRRRRA